MVSNISAAKKARSYSVAFANSIAEGIGQIGQLVVGQPARQYAA